MLCTFGLHCRRLVLQLLMRSPCHVPPAASAKCALYQQRIPMLSTYNSESVCCRRQRCCMPRASRPICASDAGQVGEGDQYSPAHTEPSSNPRGPPQPIRSWQSHSLLIGHQLPPAAGMVAVILRRLRVRPEGRHRPFHPRTLACCPLPSLPISAAQCLAYQMSDGGVSTLAPPPAPPIKLVPRPQRL